MNKSDKDLKKIKEDLISIICKIYNIDSNLFKENDNFKEHYSWDSMNGLMIMMEINSKIFGDISPEDILESDSINDLAERIFKKL